MGLPDTRLGELVAAVVSVKPAFKGKVTEESVLASARKKFVLPFVSIFLVLMPILASQGSPFQ